MINPFPSNARATLTTLSTVNPNLSCSFAIGAEAPKVDMVTVLPSSPTYRSQPISPPISIAMRAVTPLGRTLSL